MENVIPDVFSGKNIKVVFSDGGKWGKEVASVFEYAKFLKMISSINKLILIDSQDMKSLEEKILVLPEWQACSECDDEHIFSAIFLCPVSFLITTDRRLCSCREKMKSILPRKLNIKKKINPPILNNEKIYKMKRELILK
ncbi:MAG: hypothetical protein ABF636_07850 [Acetobacter sp.]